MTGLVGFLGTLLITVGAYGSHRIAVPLALLGLLMVSAAVLIAVQRTFFGPVPEGQVRMRDLGTLDLVNTIGLFSFLVLLGLLPAILMDSINFSVITLLASGGG